MRITPLGLSAKGPLVKRLYEGAGSLGIGRSFDSANGESLSGTVAYLERAFTKSEVRGYVCTPMHRALRVEKIRSCLYEEARRHRRGGVAVHGHRMLPCTQLTSGSLKMSGNGAGLTTVFPS
jgi:hypothetical protein